MHAVGERDDVLAYVMLVFREIFIQKKNDIILTPHTIHHGRRRRRHHRHRH